MTKGLMGKWMLLAASVLQRYLEQWKKNQGLDRYDWLFFRREGCKWKPIFVLHQDLLGCNLTLNCWPFCCWGLPCCSLVALAWLEVGVARGSAALKHGVRIHGHDNWNYDSERSLDSSKFFHPIVNRIFAPSRRRPTVVEVQPTGNIYAKYTKGTLM